VTPARSTTRLVAARLAVFAMFTINGFGFAMWVTHIPVITDRTSVSNSLLGTLLLVLGAAALVAMRLGGAAADRYGSRVITVSSPNSVTPAHFDIEHSLLMQVSGSKTVSFARFETDTARWHEVERYWDGPHGRIESLPPELASYSLTPGRGVYIPPVAPHWVHNGPAISLSVTLTYFTRPPRGRT
jgi:hypothetical protein